MRIYFSRHNLLLECYLGALSHCDAHDDLDGPTLGELHSLQRTNTTLLCIGIYVLCTE
jgi:hypothetical protein